MAQFSYQDRIPSIDLQIIEYLVELAFPGQTEEIKVKMFSENLFRLQIKAKRYCPFVGRQHRRNGVYFLVDVSKRTLIHKCYDEACEDRELILIKDDYDEADLYNSDSQEHYLCH